MVYSRDISTRFLQDTKYRLWFLTAIVFMFPYLSFSQSPDGFNNANWGTSSAEVKKAVNAQGWQADPVSKDFPQDLKVTVFKASSLIAGYKAVTRYYFWEDRFFQATVSFDFDKLKTFDFNYNVFRSVNEYYSVIRSNTLVFVNDVYALLRKKYGMKEPVFKGLDPRMVFVRLDAYLRQERWNLRYHPYDYYQHIITAAYARWDFPKTRVIFSINISAPDKRFDYQLSAASLDLEVLINKKMNELRMQGL